MPETRAPSAAPRRAPRLAARRPASCGPAECAVVEVAQHRRMGGRGDQQGLERPAMFGRIASRSNAPTRPRVAALEERDGEVVGPEQLQPLGEGPAGRGGGGQARAGVGEQASRGSGRRPPARRVMAGRRIARRHRASRALRRRGEAPAGVSSRPLPRAGSAGPICASSQPCGIGGRRCRGPARRARSDAPRSRPAGAVDIAIVDSLRAMRDCRPAEVKPACALRQEMFASAPAGAPKEPAPPSRREGSEAGREQPCRSATRLLAPTARAAGRSPATSAGVSWPEAWRSRSVASSTS